MDSVQIIPSMLVTDEITFQDQLSSIYGVVKMVQIDLADGRFVPNTTWTYENPETSKNHLLDIDFELHLMVENPVAVLKEWTDTPNLKRVLFHYESVSNIENTISEIKNLKSELEVGIVLNPDTPVEKILPYLDKLDTVMFMGVTPGFQGQDFIPETLDRIKELKEKNPNTLVEVDGAVNEKTLREIVKTGADIICPGSAIFGNEKSPAENVENMEKIINTLTE